MNKSTVLVALVFSVLALAQTENAPVPGAESGACDPGKSWRPIFQFPESAQQAQTGELWKVDFQELVNKGRLSADQANFLVKESPKAKESQGKLVSGYVVAFNPCGSQLLIDYKEADSSPVLDQTEVVKAALNVAAADTASQQQAAATPSPAQGKGPNAGTKAGEAVASAASFANPLALALVPAAGYVGGGIQKAGQTLARKARKCDPEKEWCKFGSAKPFSLNTKGWWRDF